MRLLVGKKKHVVRIDDADWETVRHYRLTVAVRTGTIYVKLQRSHKKIRECHYLHRFLMNAERGTIVDHIDGNGLNNCRANLRIVTSGQNAMNMGLSARNSTGTTGVCWAQHPRKYMAYITVNKKTIHLGFFHSFDAASEARLAAEIKYHGEFSRRAPQSVMLPYGDLSAETAEQPSLFTTEID